MVLLSGKIFYRIVTNPLWAEKQFLYQVPISELVPHKFTGKLFIQLTHMSKIYLIEADQKLIA